MPKVELTDRFCKSANAIEGRQTDYFDGVVKGLSLLVSPGGTKTFYLNYTRPASKKRARMKIGRYPEISLGQARERARKERGEIGGGQDPITERRSHAASQSVNDMVENYVERHASTKRSGGEIARRLRKNVSTTIGDIKLSNLHRRDVTRVIDKIIDRGAPTEANRVFEDFRAMIRWARGRGDIDENLVEGMRRPAETVERDRVLSADEIRALWGALDSASMWEATKRILRLCLITAQRVGEITGMHKDELDLEHAIWTIPADRSKNGRGHTVPLSGLAQSTFLQQIQANEFLAKRKGRAISQYVFPGPGGRSAISGAAIAKAVKRQEDNGRTLGVKPFTPHDLRRTAATLMEEAGVSPFVVGHVLNHVSITRASITSRVYARYDYQKEKREALDILANRIAGLIATENNVVPLTGNNHG